jgi:hypothetical protein
MSQELIRRMIDCLEQIIYLLQCKAAIDRELDSICRQAVRQMAYPPLEVVK